MVKQKKRVTIRKVGLSYTINYGGKVIDCATDKPEADRKANKKRYKLRRKER